MYWKTNHGNRAIPSTALVLAICNHSLVTGPVPSAATHLVRSKVKFKTQKLPLRVWCHCWACRRQPQWFKLIKTIQFSESRPTFGASSVAFTLTLTGVAFEQDTAVLLKSEQSPLAVDRTTKTASNKCLRKQKQNYIPKLNLALSSSDSEKLCHRRISQLRSTSKLNRKKWNPAPATWTPKPELPQLLQAPSGPQTMQFILSKSNLAVGNMDMYIYI